MKKFILRSFALFLAVFVIYSVAQRLPAVITELSEIAESTLPSDDLSASGDLVLVNKLYKYRNDGGKLVKIFDNKSDSYVVSSTELKLQEKAMQPLNEMMDAFKNETGNDSINILSAYRSYETQSEIYKEKTLAHGISYAKKYVQLPGTSEHHTGLAVDLGIYNRETGECKDFNNEGDYSWFTKNAWKYGFILRYPDGKENVTGISYEPWHFRYVGTVHAYYISTHNICLEEYISLLKSSKKPLKIKINSKSYKVSYYNEIPSIDCKSISGDNTGGFVVIV